METRRKILVVDDESSLLLTLVANLELEGFDVVEADSGEKALALMEGQKFDLVLSDIRMPGMNGVELFRRVRQKDPEMPVLLMTAFAFEGLVEEALTEGAFGVINKPFGIDHLVQALTIAAARPLVLVVDDERPVADSTAAALQACGIRAASAGSGQEALETVRKGEADICVVDMVMPGMDGVQVIQQIRALDPKVACIAVSGHDVPALFHRAASMVFTFFKKPLSPQELARSIARARITRAVGR
jgi:DNA-binding NtrC family response regulator